MSDTVLRPEYYDGRTIDAFLHHVLRPTPNRKHPRLSVDTAQRLAGHIDPKWLSDITAELLAELVSCEPGRQPIERLVAPAFRSIEDFRNCGKVIARLAGPNAATLWQDFDNVFPDEATGMVGIRFDNLHHVEVDPRSPTLWREDEYNLILGRKHLGIGREDRIADITRASIELSGFVANPEVHEVYVSAALRQLQIPQHAWGS